MSRADLLTCHDTLTTLARSLMDAKNRDYAGEQAAEQDSLANFRLASTMGLVRDVPTSVLVRLTDKVMRLASFCQTGTLAVKGESARDTVLDIINYAVLFDAAVKDESIGHKETA